MKKEDTRGLSTVVATLLIILLVMVAIAILWGVIRSVIKSNAESISLGKFTINLEILDVYPSNGITDTGIKVRRNAGEGELEGIIFSIFDGEKNHLYERRDVNLDELEVRTFFVPYHNINIVSVSIYPLFLGYNGNIITGDVQDTYYAIATGGSGGDDGGYIDPGCTPDCTGKECGDNRCGGQCSPGCSGGTPYCVLGDCEADNGGVEGDCSSCSPTTCIGTTCDDNLGESCPGQLQPDCGTQMCGEAPNGGGGVNACGTCDEGYHCNQGICSENCIINCAGKECGDNGCFGSCGDCEYLYGTGYSCNSSGLCEACIPDCAGKECGDNGCEGICGDCTELYDPSYNCNLSGLCEICTPDCSGGRACDPGLNGCGTCGECSGEDTCIDGFCTPPTPPEISLNNGTVLSVWPVPIGNNFL